MDENEQKRVDAPARAYDMSLFEWHAPEYHKHQKGKLWFAVASLVMIAFVIYGVQTSGWTFSIAILVFAGVYLLFHSKDPKRVPVKVSHVGIKVGNHFVPYSHMRTFWIVYRPPYISALNIRMSRKMMPDLMISLEEENPGPLREYIATQIPEWEGKEEAFTNTLVRLLRL